MSVAIYLGGNSGLLGEVWWYGWRMKPLLLVMALALAGCGGKVSDEDYARKTCYFCKEEVKGGR